MIFYPYPKSQHCFSDSTIYSISPQGNPEVQKSNNTQNSALENPCLLPLAFQPNIENSGLVSTYTLFPLNPSSTIQTRMKLYPNIPNLKVKLHANR